MTGSDVRGIYRVRNDKIEREKKAIFVERMTKNGKMNQGSYRRNAKLFVYSKLGIFVYGMKLASF